MTRITLSSKVEELTRMLHMKQDDWLRECRENDELRAALRAMMVERLEHDGFISPETFARSRKLLTGD